MSGFLKILLLEDSVADAELISWELKRAHLNHELNRVQTREDFLGALESYSPDVVLSDHTMPGYDGLSALKDMRRRRPGTPFIFVSGTLGEDRAVDSLKRGASDYVVKGDLMRLPSAIERAIKEKRLRFERETALRELKASETIFKTLAEQAPIGILLTNTKNRPTFCNEQMAEISGRGIDELMGMDYKELIHPDDQERVAAAVTKIFAEKNPGEVEYRIIRPSGETRWITSRGVGRFSPEGEPLGFIGVLMDTTEEKAAEEKIQRLVRIQEVLSGINSTIVRVNDRHQLCRDACKIAVEKGGFRIAGIILVKPGTEDLIAQGFYGMDQEFSDYLNGLAFTSVNAISLNAKHALLSKKSLIANTLDQLPNATSHTERLQRANVNAVAYLPLKVGDDVHGLIVLGSDSREFFVGEELQLLKELSDDIAFAVDHINKEERLNYLAYYDALTGLPNRALFLKHLHEEVQKAGREGRQIALITFNIERFRNINESFGEQHGDALLQAAAQRLSSRHKGYFARLRGDSFGCVVTGVVSRADFTQRLERGLDAWLTEPFQVANQEVLISFRVGAAIFPEAATDADTLFQNANAALKQAKNSSERLAFYNQEINRRVAERTHYETRLRNAVEQKQFVLHYQPKINLKTGRIGSLEALMRWEDPERGLIPPGQFIPMLEETGLIYEVGMIALQQAFDAHLELRKHFAFAPYIAVNVSALQLQRKTFYQDVLRVIGKANGGSHGIDIEITESLIMRDIEANIVKLKEVRDQNVHIAIDDFGTGYSSLSYIAKLPIDVLKIDRSFIERMTESSEARAIVSAIISLAHSLDLTVVAEGVETREQMAELQTLKCDEAQGYLFCRPIPLGELIKRMVEKEGIVVLAS